MRELPLWSSRVIAGSIAAPRTPAASLSLPPSTQPDVRHHVARLSPKSPREPRHRLQPDRPLSTLDQADVGPVQPCGVGQGLLRQPSLLTEGPDAASEVDDEAADGHG